MEINERKAGTIIEPGVQVTISPKARYFYFRQRNCVLCVRLPFDENELLGYNESQLTDEPPIVPASHAER